jgi:hypothetical protein
MNNSRWTKKEDKKLLEIISENANNLTHAFRLFNAKFPNRSILAIQYRWYAVLRPNPNTRVCLFTADKKHVNINSKNSKAPTKKFSLWKKLLDLIFK